MIIIIVVVVILIVIVLVIIVIVMVIVVLMTATDEIEGICVNELVKAGNLPCAAFGLSRTELPFLRD